MPKFKPGESGNPNGRRKGIPNKRTVILDAVAKTFKSEQGFWGKVAELADSGDTTSISILANRLIPALKPGSSYIALDLGSGDLFSDAAKVLQEIGAGNLEPTVGTALLQAINGAAKTKEIVELEERIARLETASRGSR